MRPDLASDPLTEPLTPQQSDVYAHLVRQRTAADELEQQRRRAVASALEAGLTWPVIAAGLGTEVRAAMTWYGATPHLRAATPPALTGEEQKILTLVLEGWTNQAIAESLYVSKRSLEAQLTALYRTLGVASKAELRTLRDTRPRQAS
ncbi:LuxR C-terminal-related transcriptional regulator [Microlunatus capsulatus]|uniref:DNA-binding NarL/FixJ family response regulator n=1 Tax=Microlunatus capsulatus TaxID=99117 RepID=A0ABS4Z753_9ACTN|nr:helix-turn-helix transcriptional regulator [Microlunatus capsulatus]MBP2416083.1 DNA-binding NarL/FixJ family response regulator [Microlunatus capsulatus]